MKRPDVGLYYHFRGQQYVILQKDVDSGGYQKTCIKLADGIAQQISWQRNRDDNITSCAGLYLPTFERVTSIVKLTLVWDDLSFRFRVTHTMKQLDELKETIREIVNDGISKSTSLAVRQGTRHIVPLSKRFVTSTFGEGAMQVESVVIVKLQQEKVYKHPLLDVHKLAKLLHLAHPTHSPLLTRSLLPTAARDNYIEFPLLKPPIKREKAKTNLSSFVSSVVFALNELREFGLAHLDVRLDNVCFTAEQSSLI